MYCTVDKSHSVAPTTQTKSVRDGKFALFLRISQTIKCNVYKTTLALHLIE